MDPLNTDGLRPHQVKEAAGFLERFRRFRSALDCSDTGTGKTYLTAWMASLLHNSCLVIGPKIAESAWRRASQHFGDTLSYSNYEMVRTGNTAFGRYDSFRESTPYFRCTVCQREVPMAGGHPAFPCEHHRLGIHCLEAKKHPASYGNFVFHRAIKMLVFDEAHRCNGRDSLNCEMLLAAKRQQIPTVALSATPAHSPLQMRALGYLLDLHNDREDEAILRPGAILPVRGKPSFTHWAGKYGCRYDERFNGYKWMVGKEQQKEIMLEIRNSIIPSRGIRITTDDIPGFPKRVILPELYTLDDPEKIDGCYGQMRDALAELKRHASSDKNPDHPLTKLLRAQQEVELLKVPVATELGQDDLDKGMSVVWFVNYRQTIDELLKRFPNAGVIDGSPESLRVRDRTVERFQDNSNRELIVNNKAGGVALSLQDLFGGFTRSGIVFPGYSATEFRQLIGRLHRDLGLSTCYYRVIFADGTCEVPMWRALRGKLDCLDSLVDGDMQPENLKIV